MKQSTWLKLLLFSLALLGLYFTLRAVGIDILQMSPERIKGFIISFGVWAPVIYVLAYGQPFVPLPASVMTLAGGLAFGPLWGTLAAITGATIRACAEYGLAKLLGRDMLAGLLKGKAAELDERMAANGFKTVLLIRVIPNVPFDMQNYLLGFSKVRFWPYALATLVGLIPGCFAYVYLGYSLTDPKNLWKLGLAVAVIIALMLAQRAWQKRRSPAIPSGPAPKACSAS